MLFLAAPLEILSRGKWVLWRNHLILRIKIEVKRDMFACRLAFECSSGRSIIRESLIPNYYMLHVSGCWISWKATFNFKIWSLKKISHQSRWEAKLGVHESDDGDDLERKTPHIVQVPHELPEKKWSAIQRPVDHLMLRVSSAARLSTPPRSMLFSWASSGFTWIV